MDINDHIDDIMAETLWHIDAEMDKEGWDLEPELYAVLTNPITEGVGVIELKPVLGWRMCLAMDPDPQQALATFASILQTAPSQLKEGILPADRLYGVAFVTEAWLLRTTPQEFTEFAGQDLSAHPNRIETRFIYCMSTEGKLVALNHERDGIVQLIDRNGTLSLGGVIPELLLACAKELNA